MLPAGSVFEAPDLYLSNAPSSTNLRLISLFLRQISAIWLHPDPKNHYESITLLDMLYQDVYQALRIILLFYNLNTNTKTRDWSTHEKTGSTKFNLRFSPCFLLTLSSTQCCSTKTKYFIGFENYSESRLR